METISQNFVASFGQSVTHLAQQKNPRFATHALVQTGVVGDRDTFEQMHQTEDAEITGDRFSPAALEDASHLRVSNWKRDWEWRKGIKTQDELALNINLRMAYAESAAMAFVRRRDQLILDALLGTSYTGKNGGTSVAFDTTAYAGPGSGGYVLAAAGGLTEAIMRQLREAFDINEEMLEDMEDGDRDAFCLALAPAAHDELLSETQTTSREFYVDPIFGQMPLVNGRIPFFMGFRIRVTNKLTLSGNTRYNIAWHRNSVGLSIWQSPQANIAQRTDLTGLPWQVCYGYSMGAVRLKQSGVMRVDTDES